MLSLRALGTDIDDPNGIGTDTIKQIKKLDQLLVDTILEDARRVREKDDNKPIAAIPKNLAKCFETEEDIQEYEKYHPRIKNERMSLILKKPVTYDWVSTCFPFFLFLFFPFFTDMRTYVIIQGRYKKPNDSYASDFHVAETPKNNIETFVEGLRNAERKPIAKTAFVATVLEEEDHVSKKRKLDDDDDEPKPAKKVRRALKTVDYKADSIKDLIVNDRLLRRIGTENGYLAVVTLPNDDRNKIEANLDTAFVNLKLPFPTTVDVIARLKSMDSGATNGGMAPSYLDEINKIKNN